MPGMPQEAGELVVLEEDPLLMGSQELGDANQGGN